MTPFAGYKKAYFVGIGGAGMSSLAHVMFENGFEVMGSDAQLTEVTEQLNDLGIVVTEGSNNEKVKKSDVVVYSSAIPKNNSELQTALKEGIPIVKRAEMLGEIMKKKWTIAVSGTHGKTTSTLMLGSIWSKTDWNPTVMGGGMEIGKNSGTRVGNGSFLIAEADEYDRSFLSMYPTVISVTNIDSDHLDTYGSLNNIKQAFIQFMNSLPFYGFIVANIDDPGIIDVIPEVQGKKITYALNNNADYQAFPLEQKEEGETFNVVYQNETISKITINLSGRHNISNALGAFAVSHQLGVPVQTIEKGLESFQGVSRRMEWLGNVGDIVFYDDYAHHPAEITVVLESFRVKTNKRIVVIFQPHLYSRTQQFYREFGYCLSKADIVFVLPVYAAREKMISGVDGNLISDVINNLGEMKSQFLEYSENWMDKVVDVLIPEDLVITFGAGDINLIAKKLMKVVEKSFEK